MEINPQVALREGLSEGDVVVVESPHGRVEAPVYVHPAAPPEVLAMPFGQGHAGYGRYAEGRGANLFALLASLTDESTGALAYGATRVRMGKTGRRVPFAKYEGTAEAAQVPGFEVLKVTREA